MLKKILTRGTKIPDDITSLLNDPIFEKEADVTTKEILKRYGDMSKASKVAITTAQGHGNGSREGRGAIQHVDDQNGQWPTASLPCCIIFTLSSSKFSPRTI